MKTDNENSKLYKLPKDLATKWLHDLRSGGYNQGRHKMYDSEEGSFCCLGVFIDPYIDETTLENLAKEGENAFPEDFEEAVDIEIPETIINGATIKNLAYVLSFLNDGINKDKYEEFIALGIKLPFEVVFNPEDKVVKADFNQIADFIELNCKFE